MLWTIVVVLLILWALGLVTSYTMGGLIQVLLVIAIIAILVNVIQRRRSQIKPARSFPKGKSLLHGGTICSEQY